ncbi:MAG: response regulator [Mariprofundaceae bacterium]|nr:response regulator [Mariprofundaceae bacterium]
MTEHSIAIKQAKILIVDDNEDNIDLAEQILEDDYDIITAPSGVKCIELAQSAQPDVILLDVQMPDMDGYETLAKMQAMETCKNIPVIFLSARYRDIDRVIHGLELGALDYITKPVDDDLLMAKVKVSVRIKQAEDAVRAQSAALEAANKEMEAFTYSVSHDLRAPLRTLDGFSKILLEDYGNVLDDTGKDYLQRIRVGSKKMGSLIDDLLNLSRTSKVELSCEPLDFSSLVEHVKDELLADHPTQTASFQIQSDMKIVADARLLRMVMMNLMGNALKYSGKKDAAVIAVSMEKQDKRTVYVVEDNGVGFNMKYADQLFHPFQRLHRTDEFPGNGIGLATVARIVQRHGGHVWAESEEGKGSLFYFTLEQDSERTSYMEQGSDI